MERKKIAFLAQKTHQQIDITVDVFNVLVLYYDKNIDTFSPCIIHEWICGVNNFFAIFISNNFRSLGGAIPPSSTRYQGLSETDIPFIYYIQKNILG